MRPRLEIDDLHQVRWLLGGLVLLLSVGTSLTLDLGAEVPAALAGSAILACLMWPSLPARLPAWAHRLAFPVMVAAFAVDLWMTGQILPSMVRMDLLLMVYRGITYRQRRDDLQVVVLGLFMVVVAGVLTVAVGFALQILVFTALALGLLLANTLVDHATKAPPPPPGVPPPWARSVRWPGLIRRLWAVADWRLLSFGAVLFAAVVALSAGLFLAIPRFQLENSLFLERFVSKKARTGFNDAIKFGDVTDILQDDGIALNADISDPSRAPAVPYWRMLVLDEYRDGGFRMSAALRSSSLSRERSQASVRGTSPPLGEPAWTLYLEAGVSRYLPLLGRFELLRFRESQNFRTAIDLGIVALRDEPVTMTAYRVEGMPGSPALLPDPAFAARWRHRSVAGAIPLQTSLGVGAADASLVQSLVAEAAGDSLGDASLFASKVSAYLRARHGYSLSPRIPSGAGDPLVRWLSSTQAGHCELFAGSFVLMARSAGYPARVVTGFKGGSWNAYSNNFTVRNSDAHAWAEIWDASRGGWLRADPLEPAASATDQGASAQQTKALPVDRSFSARLTSLRVFWYRRIVDFDQRSQLDTLRAIRAATQDSGKWIRESAGSALSRLRSFVASPWDLRRLAGTFGALGAVALTFWLGARARRWLFLRVGGRGMDPVRRQAGVWLSRIHPAAEPYRDLQRLRYGPRKTWPRPPEVFERARRAPRRRRPS